MTRARIAIAATDETRAAFQSVGQRIGALSGEAASLTSKFSGLTAGLLGLLGSAGAFGAFVTRTTQAVSDLQDLKDASGSSIENLSRLTSVAQRAGIDFGTVSQSLLKFNQNLANAKEGSAAAAVFERLGLSLEQLRKQDPTDALVAVAQGLGRFADDGAKARAQAVLFGEGVGRIAPLLKELNGGLGAGALLTTKQAEAYDGLAKSVSKLTTELQELGVRAAGPAVAGLARLFELSDKAKAAGFGGLLDAALAFNTTELDRLGNLNERLTVLVTRYREVSSLVEGIRASGKAVPRELESELASLERRERFLRALQKERGGGRGDGGAAAESIGAFASPAGVQASKAAVAQYTEGLRDQLLALRTLTTEEQARIAINRGLVGVLAEADRTQILSLARAVDSSRLLKAAEEQSVALKAEGARLTATLRTEQEVLNDEIERADKLLQAGAITVDTWGRAWQRFSAGGIKDATDALARLRDFKLPNLTLPLQQVDERARSAGRSIEDAFSGSILSAFKRDTGSILEIWGDMIQRLTAQALAARLTTSLFGDLASTGQLGGFVGNLLSFGGARANGGPVSPGRAYLVGERGPEVIVPRGAGNVVPNEALGGLTVNYNVAAGVTRGEMVAALQLMGQQTRAEVLADLRARRVI
jgi:hypothetical protein